MKIKTNLFILAFLLVFSAEAQNYLGGLYQISTNSYNGKQYTLFSFSRQGNKLKAKYFVRNPKSLTSLQGKKILFVCSGAFSVNWDPNSPPIGVCVDKGMIINRNVDTQMDGLVVVYNGGAQMGGVVVSNLDKEPINVGAGADKKSFWIKNNDGDKIQFLNWAKTEEATVFQTQLMYSTKGYEFPLNKLSNGNPAERRFLAICKINGSVQHVIVNAPQSDHLNQSAKNVVEMLQSSGYEIFGLLNLDTGGRNYMAAYNDKGSIVQSNGKIEDAINLVIYYAD